MYAKLENGVLQYAPRNFETIDGLIINFDQNKELMEQYGFKEVINIYPVVGENQYTKISGYTEDENSITVNYEVVDVEPYVDPYESILKEEANK